MFKRYNRIDVEDGREAMRKLETYLSRDQRKAKQLKRQEECRISYWNRTAEALEGPPTSA